MPCARVTGASRPRRAACLSHGRAVRAGPGSHVLSAGSSAVPTPDPRALGDTEPRHTRVAKVAWLSRPAGCLCSAARHSLEPASWDGTKGSVPSSHSLLGWAGSRVVPRSQGGPSRLLRAPPWPFLAAPGAPGPADWGAWSRCRPFLPGGCHAASVSSRRPGGLRRRWRRVIPPRLWLWAAPARKPRTGPKGTSAGRPGASWRTLAAAE